MKIFGKTQSDNIKIDGNGQMIILNVVMARTGEQEYLGMEISDQLDPNQIYIIERNPEDVFNEAFMASFENKPFVELHPDVDVTIHNNKEHSVGIIRNIRPGVLKVKGLDKRYYDENGNNVLLTDIVVTEAKAVSFIQSELKKPEAEQKIDVSGGYDAAYMPIGEEKEYRMRQKGTMGNHLALVPKGRAGIAKIRDSIVLEHNNKYFKKTLPYPFEQGLKKLGITKYSLEIMKPQQYYDELVYKAKTHYQQEVQPSNDEQLNEMRNYLHNGGEFDLPFILYNSLELDRNDQDGRHRVEVMKRLGVEDVPVLIFYKTKEATTMARDEMSKEIKAIIESLTLDASPDSLIDTAIEAWKKVKADRSTSIKEATKIAGILDLLKAAKGKGQEAQLIALKKARSIGQEIKAAKSKDEEMETNDGEALFDVQLYKKDEGHPFMKQQQMQKVTKSEIEDLKKKWAKVEIIREHKKTGDAEQLTEEYKKIDKKRDDAFRKYTKAAGKYVEMDKKHPNKSIVTAVEKAFAEWDKLTQKLVEMENAGTHKVKDAKPIPVKFKDMKLEMVGFESKKEAREMALIMKPMIKNYTLKTTKDSVAKSKEEWKQIIKQFLQTGGFKGSISFKGGGMSGEYYQITVDKDTDMDKLYNNVVYPFNNKYGSDYVYLVVNKK